MKLSGDQNNFKKFIEMLMIVDPAGAGGGAEDWELEYQMMI